MRPAFLPKSPPPLGAQYQFFGAGCRLSLLVNFLSLTHITLSPTHSLLYLLLDSTSTMRIAPLIATLASASASASSSADSLSYEEAVKTIRHDLSLHYSQSAEEPLCHTYSC